MIVACAAGSGGWWERLQAREGGGELAGPGPSGLQAQRGAAGVEGESSGSVQQPVAQSLGLAGRQLAVEAQRLRPDGEVLGDHRELDPDRVERELAKGEVL